MISIRSSDDLERALAGAMNPDLRELLALRRDQLTANTDIDLGDLAHLIIAGRGDALAMLEAEAGFPLVGDDAPIEWVQRHPGGWLEAVIVTDDEGFSVAILVRDCICTDPALLVPLLAAAS